MYQYFHKLRVRFAELEMKQGEVAKRANMAESTLTARMTGRLPWNGDEIARVAKVLDIPTDQIGAFFFVDAPKEYKKELNPMNDISEVNSSLNEYGFESYSFPAEVAEHDDLQALDLEFCKFAQATGTNYIEMCKRVAAIHAKLARAGRYGGGQWLAWCKIRGLGKDSAYRMTTIGDNFNVRNLSTLNTLQLENMPKSLLYAASKNNVSPVTWELLSSSDPQDVEVGKGLLEAEKGIAKAREEFRLALDAAKTWYAYDQQHPGVFVGNKYEIMRQIAQCDTVAEVEALTDERLNKFCTEKPLNQRTPEEVAAFFRLEI